MPIEPTRVPLAEALVCLGVGGVAVDPAFAAADVAKAIGVEFDAWAFRA